MNNKMGVYRVSGRFMVDGKVGDIETRIYVVPNVQEAERKMYCDGLVRERSDIGLRQSIEMIDQFSQIKLFHDDITIR